MPLVPTVRIPELPPLTSGLDLSLLDRLPLWIQSENKTKYADLQSLLTFFGTGGGGTAHPPVYWGGQMLYKVSSGIAPGTTIASIPALAGLDFALDRGGFPMEALLEDLSNAATAEFEVLDAGGFQLLQSGDELQPNERFKLTIFSLIGGSGPATPGTSSSFITGIKNVTTNVTLDASLEMNKLIQLRALATQVTVTLPSVDDVAANSFLVIESSINNSKENAVATSGSQNIYFNNTSKTALYIRPGESLWLFRYTDGWYVINDFYRNYTDLGKPFAAYKIGNNEILCNGQELLRSEHRRLWEYAQTLGSSLVTDATWLTASAAVAGRTATYPYRGCFSTANGSTTFRIPDLMSMFLRGLRSDTGSDTERHLNKAGGYQRHEFESHTHRVKTSGNNIPDPMAAIKRTSVSDGYTDVGAPIEVTGGVETRGENVGVLWCIRA